MSGPFKRRPSLKTLPPGPTIKSASLRRRSSLGTSQLPSPSQQEVPWDVVDRCLLPLIYCQAAAFIFSTVLNALNISQVSALTLFILLSIITIALILFYHNLKIAIVGKAVLLTGCDSRMGYALARYLDELGFTVFAGFQSIDDNPYADDLKEESSGRLHVLQLDVSSETQVLAASLYIVEHLPDDASGLWAVIHAANYFALGEIEWIPYEAVKRATEINLVGATRVTQVMAPLVRRARGRIVFVSSGLCRVTSAVRGIHCALFSAIEAEAACLRQELRSRGVDVITVAPGEFTACSSWLTDELLVEEAREMWGRLSKEQKREYGADYFETAIRSLEKYTKVQV
ncbi:short-chain dehydrogenase/reductase family 9c [Holotrichia oblita]|uniref:Short-chain dehydrogenase/reductase family 9c n=2 Tax=Holotrichia oblita TaxID=644536 RepID=A0ACB9STB0_HOLOL|nr:short-chain dehydrogenase/reductase family 9c [Holotrichia oblita]